MHNIGINASKLIETKDLYTDIMICVLVIRLPPKYALAEYK